MQFNTRQTTGFISVLFISVLSLGMLIASPLIATAAESNPLVMINTALEEVLAACPSFPIDVATEAELNEAIGCYNEAPAGDYEISITADIALITNTTPITNPLATSLRINGEHHVIDGDQKGRVLNIQNSNVTIYQLTIKQGDADEIQCGGFSNKCGGAIYIAPSGVVYIGHTSVMNSSAYYGAGIYNEGELWLNSSTISKNMPDAYGAGGGIYNVGGHVTIINSTISDNYSSMAGGGGIYNSGQGEITIEYSTIADNLGGIGGIGAGIYNRNGSVILKNTILMNHSGYEDCNDHNLGTIIADATNLDKDGTCGDATTSNNIKLGPLQDNSGSTWTHALLPGSDAINAGTPNPEISFDQRGIRRPQGAAPDIGAYEFVCRSFPVNVATEYELNAAFSCFNDAPAGEYEINITSDILLSSSIVAIDNPHLATLKINGNAYSIDGDLNYGILIIHRGDVAVTNWNLLRGHNFSDPNHNGVGGAVYIALNSSFSLYQSSINNSNGGLGSGGGIYNGGTLILNQSTLSSNSAHVAGGGIDNVGNAIIIESYFDGNTSEHRGGAIINTGDGNLDISNSTFTNNKIDNFDPHSTLVGGGIDNTGTLSITNSLFLGNETTQDGGAIINGGSATIIKTTLSGNSADLHGGGIYNYGTLVVKDSTIFDNTSFSQHGGGIYNEGEVSLINSTISANYSGYDGGGFHNESGNSTITNSTISNNETVWAGGGAYNRSGTLTIKNSLITNNTATNNRLAGDCFNSATLSINVKSIDSDGSCGFATTSSSINLGSLQDNGGPTWTHALLEGSDAIDAGDNSICSAALVNGVDQRGVTRPQGSSCDIGAYEYIHPVTPTPTYTPTPEPTNTSTLTPTPTNTNTPTPTSTSTKTPIPTSTSTKVPTNTPTSSPTSEPVYTATPSTTPVQTATSLPTSAPTKVPTNTPSPTSTPTSSPTTEPVYTATPSTTPVQTATSLPTVSPTTTPPVNHTPTPKPTETVMGTPAPSSTPAVTPEPSTAFTLAGRVVDSAGNPLEEVTVTAMGGSGSHSVTVMTDENGEYLFTLPNGVYTFSFEKDGYDFSGTSVTVTINGGSRTAPEVMAPKEEPTDPSAGSNRIIYLPIILR